MTDQSELLDELARCFAQAAVERFLRDTASAVSETGPGKGAVSMINGNTINGRSHVSTDYPPDATV